MEPSEPKHYEMGSLTVNWQPEKCIHSGKCVQALPRVFNPRRRPWIELEHAQEEAIRTAVRNCPSGALSLPDEADLQQL